MTYIGINNTTAVGDRVRSLTLNPPQICKKLDPTACLGVTKICNGKPTGMSPAEPWNESPAPSPSSGKAEASRKLPSGRPEHIYFSRRKPSRGHVHKKKKTKNNLEAQIKPRRLVRSDRFVVQLTFICCDGIITKGTTKTKTGASKHFCDHRINLSSPMRRPALDKTG